MHWREAGARDAPVALLLHGFPGSSHTWAGVLDDVAAAGFRAVAPDLHGFGASPPFADRAGAWTDHVDALDAFVAEHDLAPLVLVAHDWGGLIGLRWACERPYALRGLVLSGTGFFPDARWHGLAQGLRTPGQGEQLVAAITRESFAALLRQAAPGVGEAAVDEYFRALEDDRRKQAVLTLYRSGEFAELAAYDGCLERLGVPALLVWGDRDDFAPIGGAHRFARALGAELVVVEGCGHFLLDEQPGRVGAELRRFLTTLV
jgi:haloalkane dehalogenase